MTSHSIAELIKQIAAKHPEVRSLLQEGGKLDQYYLTTRYPEAVAAPAIPSEIFTEDQARDALDIARRIMDYSNAIIAS